MKKSTLFLTAVIVLGTSCKKEKVNDPITSLPPQALEVHLSPKMDGQNYSLNQVITSPQGYDYYFTNIKILGTDMQNGSNLLSESYLYDYELTGSLMRSVKGERASFTNLNFNIGVPNILNHADPSLPSATSALNIANAGDMHWGWNPGYIFAKLEGKVDTTNNGVADFNHNFVFHLGTDEIFRSLNFTDLTWNSIGDNKFRTNFNLLVKEIFDKASDPIDLRVQYSSHSSPSQMVLSNKVVDNLQNAILKE